MRPPRRTCIACSGVVLRGVFEASAIAGLRQAHGTRHRLRDAPPLSDMPERFTPAHLHWPTQVWAGRGLTPSAADYPCERPLFPALSSPSRPFCLSVSGAVAPSAVGLAYPLSPAGIDRLFGHLPRVISTGQLRPTAS